MTRGLLAVGPLCAALALAQTQVDLTRQVRNPLPYATGGTNASSQIAARASVGTPKLVATDFTGADIGQQINNAFASFAPGACGTVLIPQGAYTYSTTIYVPPGCTLEGQGDGANATQLIYNGPPATVAVTMMRSDFTHGDDTNVRNLNILTSAGVCPNNGMLAWNTAASGSNKWQCFDGTAYTAPAPHLAAILHGQIDPTQTGDSSRNTIENVEINGQSSAQGGFHFGVYLNGCEECVLKTVSVFGADDGFYIGAASNGNLYDQLTARFNRRSGIHSRGFNASTFLEPLMESNQWLGHSVTPGYGIGFLCDGENAVGSCDVRVYGAYYEANWLDISAPDVNHPLTGYVGATGTKVNRGNIASNIQGYFEDATLQGCEIQDGTKVHVLTSGAYLSYDCFVASGAIDDNNGAGGRLIHTDGGRSLSISQASAAMSWSFDQTPGGHTPMTFTDVSPVGAGSYGLLFNVANNATGTNTSIAPPTINMAGQGWASGPAASQRLLYQLQLQPQAGTSQVGGYLAFNAQVNAAGDIGAPPTVARLFPNGAFEATQFEAARSTPVAAVQSGAGAGGSCTTEVNLGSSDMSGRLYLTTGTSGWAAGIQCTLTFANGLSGWATLTPANAVTAAAMSSRQVYVGGGGAGSNQFTVNFGVADTAATSYAFNWHAIGNY